MRWKRLPRPLSNLSAGEGTTTAGAIVSTRYNTTTAEKLALSGLPATQVDHILVCNRLAEFGAVPLWLTVR
jgi:hypothetical protein